MQLPNPNSDKPFTRVSKDQEGNPEYGFRNEHTPDEEIVHIPTGRSNMTYYQPEMVMNPEGCSHEFVIESIGKREIICTKCHFPTNFHVGINYSEENGKSFITLRDVKYPIVS